MIGEPKDESGLSDIKMPKFAEVNIGWSKGETWMLRGMQLQICVKALAGRTITLDVGASGTVDDVKI